MTRSRKWGLHLSFTRLRTKLQSETNQHKVPLGEKLKISQGSNNKLILFFIS